MKRRLLLCCLVTFACTSVPRRSTDGADVARTISAVPAAHLQDPSFSDVLNVLRSSRARTVNEGVRAIAAAYPNFVAEYALVYDSFSIQKASFLKPRAIVYGRSARTIVTFNDESAAGGPGGDRNRLLRRGAGSRVSRDRLRGRNADRREA